MPQSISKPLVRSWHSLDGAAALTATLAGFYAIAGGVVTICGWVFNIPRLTDWPMMGISMFVNTALCAILCGLGLLLLVRQKGPWRDVLVRTAAVLAALIGGLTFCQHVFGWNLKVDTLFAIRPWGQSAAMAPMRMGPPASSSFLILGTTLVLATLGPAARRVASLLAIVPLVVASLSLVGYWFGADRLFGVARYTGIAWQASTMVAALGVGVLAAVPEYGIAAAMRRRDAGGVLLRRLVVPIIVLPLILGWLRILGQDAGYYDTAFGTAMRTLVEIVLLIGLLWWAAISIGGYAMAAHEAGTHLAAIVESTDDAVVSKSLDGTIRTWNAGARRLFGYTESEAVGQHISLIIPEDRRDAEVEILERTRRGEQIQHYETTRLRKDGTQINVSLTVSPVRDVTGNIVGASKIARDVTQRKVAEEVVRRSEQELRMLADSIPQLAWMARPDGHIFWYNRRWYEYTGTKAEQMEGWGWQSMLDEERLPEVLDRWKHSIATGTPFEMEFPLRGADGKFRWFLTRSYPLRDDSGRVVRWFGTNTDVEAVKRVEQTLREQTHTLELLNQTGTTVGSTLELDQLLQGVTEIATQLSGAQFGAFFYNKTDDDGDAYLLYTLSGAPREAFKKFGQPRSTPLFGPTFRGEGTIRSDDILKDPRYGKMEPHRGMPKGHLPVRSYLAVPVVSRTGEVIGGLLFGHSELGVFTEQAERLIVGVAAQAAVAVDNARLYDGLKRAAAERELLLENERSAREEAERVNVMKDEFLATLSHELRTPLNAIMGWSQLLGLGKSGPAEIQQGLEAIERNARAQTELINDLLDMSRIVSGKVRLDVQWTDLAEVVDAAVSSVQPAADAKQVRLRKIIDPNAGHVSGDPSRLQQVVWNLLTNSIKFTPKGGKVDVLLERVNSHLEITVHDSGIGIDPEFLPHVFERFRQADASSSRPYGGLGLGLSIVKNLVELHGGSVRVESPGEGQGATFTVCLPLAPVRSGPGREHPAVSARSGMNWHEFDLVGVKVLVVDDEPDARELILHVLNRCEVDVQLAQSADEGLELVRSKKPDVIISDIGMPTKDGYQFLRDVRSLAPEEGGKTPAIALTAFARSEDRTRAIIAGYQVHVAKPIEPQELVATVASLAGRV